MNQTNGHKTKGTPAKVCGAKARSTGEPCRKPAGWGTPNDTGRCRLHGGATPIKHGRYSKVKRETIRNRIERYQKEGRQEALDLSSELAVARSLLEEALDDEALDPTKVMPLVAEVSRIVKRVEDIQAQNALSLKELQRLMMEMGRIVAQHVEQQAVIDRIRQDWRTVRL